MQVRLRGTGESGGLRSQMLITARSRNIPWCRRRDRARIGDVVA